MEQNNEPSVWYVASVALAIFVTVLFISGMFAGTETIAAVAS